MSRVLAVVVALSLAAPAFAQVRYLDKNGVAHWVQSEDQVPSEYQGNIRTPRLPQAQNPREAASDEGGFVPVTDPDLMIRLCRNGIVNRLKSPASAQMDLTVYSRFKVGGDVDAQNSYGGMMRTFASCDFSLNGQLESVHIGSAR